MPTAASARAILPGRGYRLDGPAGGRLRHAKLDSPAFAAYLRESERRETLTREQERALGLAIQQGTRRDGTRTPRAQAAYERLVSHHLRLVVHLAARYAGHDGLGAAHLPDYVAAGNIGLCEAAARWVSRNGASFATYAAWWIRVRCEAAAVHEATHGARLPRSVVSFSHLRTFADGLQPWQYAALMSTPESLDAPEPHDLTVHDDDAPRLAERIAQPQPDPDPREQQRALMRELMASCLNAEQRAVLTMRYGLADPHGKPLAVSTVCKRLRLNGRRVAAIEAEAITILRAAVAAHEARQAARRKAQRAHRHARQDRPLPLAS